MDCPAHTEVNDQKDVFGVPLEAVAVGATTAARLGKMGLDLFRARRMRKGLEKTLTDVSKRKSLERMKQRANSILATRTRGISSATGVGGLAVGGAAGATIASRRKKNESDNKTSRRVYLDRHEDPPPGVRVLEGPRGGRYYRTDQGRRSIANLPRLAVFTTRQSRRIGTQLASTFEDEAEDPKNVERLKARVLPHLLRQAEHRSTIIGRTEAAVLRAGERLAVAQAITRKNPQAKFQMRGPMDETTTRLSNWIRTKIGDGKTLSEVLEIIDEGIAKAKDGHFINGGPLDGVPGKPILLPKEFRRRGTVSHFQDRNVLHPI